ncbi:MAG: Hsp20/alpha crystallin family protein [Nitrososphaerota archaeon]|jgi:HSP20 family protein|nr:Hsp20/alpha crystallin family protein [Nitrososphaerota archaeon]MDG6948769.1 Hsp20/alpha crystallin family protein [Nitrososphaerota archaeon]
MPKKDSDRTPFDEDPIFGPMMDEIRELFDTLDLDSMFANGPVVHGYSMTVGPDGVPVVREFGNAKYPHVGAKPRISDAVEPLVDVIKSDRGVSVIAEVPGIALADVNTEVSDGRLTIEVGGKRRYSKSVGLPNGEYSPPHVTYNNGILEVRLDRRGKQ